MHVQRVCHLNFFCPWPDSISKAWANSKPTPTLFRLGLSDLTCAFIPTDCSPPGLFSLRLALCPETEPGTNVFSLKIHSHLTFYRLVTLIQILGGPRPRLHVFPLSLSYSPSHLPPWVLAFYPWLTPPCTDPAQDSCSIIPPPLLFFVLCCVVLLCCVLTQKVALLG